MVRLGRRRWLGVCVGLAAAVASPSDGLSAEVLVTGPATGGWPASRRGSRLIRPRVTAATTTTAAATRIPLRWRRARWPSFRSPLLRPGLAGLGPVGQRTFG